MSAAMNKPLSTLLLSLLVSLLFLAGARGEDPPGGISEEEFQRMHERRQDAAPPRKGQRIELGGDRVYLSLPEGSGPFPAVVVIHEWWGLNEHIEHWADRLAAEGYAALAVDLYGGQVAQKPEEAMALMKGLDPEQSRARLKAAAGFLRNDARVKAPRVGSIGWCLGGAWSLELALADPALDACVIYYGRLVTDPERLKAIQAPICGIFANQDRSIPPEAVTAFDEALTKAGVAHELHRYDADHAFANPSGQRYASKPATDAWDKAKAFLAMHLRAQK